MKPLRTEIQNYCTAPLNSLNTYMISKSIGVNKWGRKKTLYFVSPLHQGLLLETDVEIAVDHLTRLVVEEDDVQVR